MLKNYFNVGFRSLLKNKVYSFINIFGLAIGIAAFLLIFQYVTFEKSYENFVESKENIYRVQLDVYNNGELTYKSSENYPGAGPAILSDLPEVIRSAKLYNIGAKNNIVVTREDTPEPIVFKHKKLLYAEADFLPMFSYEMVFGDAETALKEPFKIAISESASKKYFGDENPLGKFLRLEDDDFNNELCEVTGVFQDSPANTHLKFDVLLSFETLMGRGDYAENRYGNGWRRKDHYTYVQLSPGTDPADVEAKLPALVEKYAQANIERNQRDVLLLQPITDIHLKSRLTDEPEVHGSADGVYYLSVIAFFILIIAWVNYVNLSTSRALDRGREVGLRKVLGSYRRNLIIQFLVEAFVINGLALLLAFGLIFLITPYFTQLGGTPEAYNIWLQPWFWGAVGTILLVGSFLSGIYPAFVLSSFKPVAVLHGKLKTSGSGMILRKALVVFQFATSVAMIIGTWTVYNQMNHMQDQDIGLNIEQTVVVERPSKRDTSFQVVMNSVESFKNGLNREPDIEYVAGSTMLPGKKLRFRTPIRTRSQSEEEAVIFAAAWVDYEFAESMGLEVLAGRNFSKEMNDHDDTVTVITKSGARGLGFRNIEEAVGQRIPLDIFRMELKVIGVVEDYHQESLKEQMMPVLFGTGRFIMDYYHVKVNTNNMQSTLSKIENQWYQSFPGNPFEYFFLDEYFNSYYESDRQFRDLFASFSVLAILIGCLGLFGLSSFAAMQKTKEIAIRKVLGSSVANIITLLSKEFLVLVGIATLIAWPMVYFAMDEWLSNYPYRTEIDWWSFVVSGLAVVFVAVVTIGYQTIKSALANPVDALNYE
ncbi:MAG: ABC transporter permease [Cyclobacteriaceae bacterium]